MAVNNTLPFKSEPVPAKTIIPVMIYFEETVLGNSSKGLPAELSITKQINNMISEYALYSINEEVKVHVNH